ncbi:MAG: hypothetical protein SWX82_18970 [Cyanobacteriota bacterium]|nr:hypothetical protein [Cyanobacteriota bacterium]
MSEYESKYKSVAITKDSTDNLASSLGQQLSSIKSDRNCRAWDIYKEIVASSGMHHYFNGEVDRQYDLIKIATFALSAAECFEDAVKDYDS